MRAFLELSISDQESKTNRKFTNERKGEERASRPTGEVTVEELAIRIDNEGNIPQRKLRFVLTKPIKLCKHR